MASSSKSEDTESTPVHNTKITWPIKKESYDLKDVIGKPDMHNTHIP